mmetsp:Transcript_7795/g.21630  ORF Transcript_7795/g.21630 Transcript_7795/m.21630 type:complete len:202 (+) Transcript_7795:177-782(+)
MAEVHRCAAVVLVVGQSADAWVHDVHWVHLHPPLPRRGGRLVLCAVAVLRRQFAARVLDGVLDHVLRLLNIHLRTEDEVFMVDIAAKVRVDATLCDGVLPWQHRVLCEVLRQRVINGEALHAHAGTIDLECDGHDKAEEVGPALREGIGANVVLHVTFRLRRHEPIQQALQRIYLALVVLGKINEHVVVELFSQIAQRLGQ